jgi:hypothetical protein
VWKVNRATCPTRLWGRNGACRGSRSDEQEREEGRGGMCEVAPQTRYIWQQTKGFHNKGFLQRTARYPTTPTTNTLATDCVDAMITDPMTLGMMMVRL